MRAAIVLGLVLLVQWPIAGPSRATGDNPAHDEMVRLQADALFDRSAAARSAAIQWFATRGRKDAIPVLIQALRFESVGRIAVLGALEKLAGESAGPTWADWMLWQEAHPEIEPIAGFAGFKARVYERIDPNFNLFLKDGIAHDIRLEEIVWGGVAKDGIPALTNPTLIKPHAADYLNDEDLVFGVAINGDARAYPLRILDWHEMFNDVIGGVPVSLAYCTLCGSGILFETTVEGRDKPFVFGSSGFLYRSNKLMYDTATNSLWNQFTGKPVVGPLTGSGIELRTQPVVITSWKRWLSDNPDTRVISLETGHRRDYAPGSAYSHYFSSPELMFPTLVDETQLKAKDYVFALRGSAQEKAWPVSLFEGGKVINDTAGVVSVTLIGDAATRTVRAYRTQGEAFQPSGNPANLILGDAVWTVAEDGLTGPSGQSHPRLPGHIAYWFAWDGYLGKEGELASPGN